ncbi:endolytic transglycosylase MltG [Sinomonas sp. R1AF57]|uniref:endolytic transglycosylase MltG n=1 Tax=Sinomonas sp. R1AF57 TaxID=2020377 RepID=UPI002101B6B4|nr:endolytic transglycosylase MltG [Sinomonas sp. R1AF57]
MDPQENTTPAVPDRPLTRRELRERERARQEAQQRMLTPQRRAYAPPPSAFPRLPSDPTPPAPTATPSPAAAAALSGAFPTSSVQPASSPAAPAHDRDRQTPQGRRRGSFSAAAPAESPSRPEAPQARPSSGTSPTSAAMGWGAYPPSSGPSALAFTPPSPVPAADAGPPAVVPEPVVPAPTPARSAEPALPPPTAFFPAVPESAPATVPVSRVSSPDEQTRARTGSADQQDRRSVFPLAAQGYTRGHAGAGHRHADTLEDSRRDEWHVQAPAGYGDEVQTAVHDHGHDHAYDHGHDHAYDEPHEVDHAVFGEPVVAPAPSKRSRRFRLVVGLGLAIALFVGASLVVVQILSPVLGIGKVTDYPGPGEGSVTVTVQPGSGPAAVANSLEKQGVVADANTFLKAFAATGGSLHPGDYTFKKEMPSSDAAQVLAGTSGEKVIYLALNAGLRVSESLDEIAKAASVDRKDLDALNAKPSEFGLPAQAKNLEGYLAPGEYRLPVGSSAKDILSKLVNTTLDELKQAGVTDPAKQYQVLTVASIVQAEGGRADYGNVAGAIYNRLKPNPETNGLIQSDATVTYGIGKKSYHISEAEKADQGNAYNTYQHAGLPPGPIGSPGATAIQAAAKPTPNDYLYWVTVNLDTGETKFSKTYAEHLGYAQQYEQWCQANAGKCK